MPLEPGRGTGSWKGKFSYHIWGLDIYDEAKVTDPSAAGET